MSVRKVYRLLFNKNVIATGSYASVLFAYNAVMAVMELDSDSYSDDSLVIAFVPSR